MSSPEGRESQSGLVMTAGFAAGSAAAQTPAAVSAASPTIPLISPPVRLPKDVQNQTGTLYRDEEKSRLRARRGAGQQALTDGRGNPAVRNPPEQAPQREE